MTTLSNAAVRGLMLAAQGLQAAPQPPATKDDLLAVIRQLHMLQIDTINVVARAPYFVLWSRLGAYPPQWLDELLAEGKIFEFWAYAMCFLPIEDDALYRVGNRWVDFLLRRTGTKYDALAAEILARVREHGEVRSADFVSKGDKKPDWTFQKDEKVALELLFNRGELMIKRRDKFQRVYDLRERVYPAAAAQPTIPAADAHDQLVLYAIQALGVTTADWISNYYRFKQADTAAALKRLDRQGRLATVTVEGWRPPAYVDPANLPRIEAAAHGDIPRAKTTLLSPFDPLLRSQARVQQVFNFDYVPEYYFPADKRKYGYYSLPILYKNALVGRLDPKADRKKGIFEVKSLHLEPEFEIDDAFVTALRSTLRTCAMWHETPQVIVRDATDPDLIDLLSD